MERALKDLVPDPDPDTAGDGLRRDRLGHSTAEQTIADFGDQWQRYTDNEGYYGSADLFADMLGGALRPEDFHGASVAEIGSGTGRIVSMLLEAGAAKVVAIEPSAAFEVLARNVGDDPRVELLSMRGDELPPGLELDFVVSIGVIHHIPDPDPVIRAARAALRAGGRIVIWVYGREGNRGFVGALELLRKLTVRLPHAPLALLAAALTAALEIYIPLCRLLPLPMRDYARHVLGRFSRRKRYLVVYDQLKPAYAKYYTGQEAVSLLERAGFESVTSRHRRGYSWTVVGTNPGSPVPADQDSSRVAR